MVSTPRLESADEGDADRLESLALLPLSEQSRGVLAGRHAMRSLLMAGFLLVAVGIVAAQPPGRWLLGSTGRGTARWTEDGAGLTYRGGAAFGWGGLPGSPLRDGLVQGRFKPIARPRDQAGGGGEPAARRPHMTST